MWVVQPSGHDKLDRANFRGLPICQLDGISNFHGSSGTKLSISVEVVGWRQGHLGTRGGSERDKAEFARSGDAMREEVDVSKDAAFDQNAVANLQLCHCLCASMLQHYGSVGWEARVEIVVDIARLIRIKLGASKIILEAIPEATTLRLDNIFQAGRIGPRDWTAVITQVFASAEVLCLLQAALCRSTAFTELTGFLWFRGRGG
mmetsp:Transcript_48388/g.118458  ORF Transcript_48388/g.118458 Transcript_48388/m.118458 type:complete len:204 (-) Transcript_48388:938-1549(-)